MDIQIEWEKAKAEAATEEGKKKEAKFWKDKHILETVPKLLSDEPNARISAIGAGVSPENYDKIKAEKNRKEKIEEEINWDNLIGRCNKFLIYDGSERIYNIFIDEEIIKLEGKEIMDYNIFILKLFEKKGIMLPTFRGIKSEWAKIVTSWRKNFGCIALEKSEEISESEEAKDTILDYINNCSIIEEHAIKEGVITLKENLIYVPTRIIKKILKRNSLNVSMRKLAYLLDDYLSSGSIPLKIENRSERFWKFKSNKFEIKKDKIIEVVKEQFEDEP